jgi:hypothetical protein
MLFGGVLLFGALAIADAPKKTLALSGTFNWSMEKPQKEHALTATLTPVGENEWSAVWCFTWDDKPTSWTGTVKGDLVKGKSSGTGFYPDNKSTFTFDGTATDGVVKFSSAKIMPDKTTQPMGTGSFSVK